MKNRQDDKVGLLTDKEMKSVKGGHVFTASGPPFRCPACGEWVEIGIYTFYVRCPYCGGQIILEEKDEE